jgi:NDP-sugar pyrophosphorylase family protein
VVLAAGAGERLRPLTLVRPKPLCPVNNMPLVDHALARVTPLTDDVAVNLHHGRAEMAEHLDASAPDVHQSVEETEALGTAGALGFLRPWIDGRATVVVNADTWAPGSLEASVAAWDRERVKLLLAGDDTLQRRSRIVAAYMPWPEVAPLEPQPTGLYEVSWRRLAADDLIEVERWDGPCIDVGIPAAYLAANMAASSGKSVVGKDAVVVGSIERSVVWDGADVRAGERLVDAIRADVEVTVYVR